MRVKRDALSTGLEVVSAAAVVAGAGVWSVAAGLVAAGMFGLMFARGVAR
jgi:hypothetical protein